MIGILYPSLQLPLLNESGIKCWFITIISHFLKSFIPTYRGLDRQTCTHQARIGIIQSVIQSLPLEYSKKEGMIKLAGVCRNKLIHTMFLKTICICKFRKACRVHLLFRLNDGQIQVVKNTKCRTQTEDYLLSVAWNMKYEANSSAYLHKLQNFWSLSKNDSKKSTNHLQCSNYISIQSYI